MAVTAGIWYHRLTDGRYAGEVVETYEQARYILRLDGLSVPGNVDLVLIHDGRVVQVAGVPNVKRLSRSMEYLLSDIVQFEVSDEEIDLLADLPASRPSKPAAKRIPSSTPSTVTDREMDLLADLGITS